MTTPLKIPNNNAYSEGIESGLLPPHRSHHKPSKSSLGYMPVSLQHGPLTGPNKPLQNDLTFYLSEG
jgi:hypothetical protein